jgi:hypothetical protein
MPRQSMINLTRIPSPDRGGHDNAAFPPKPHEAKRANDWALVRNGKLDYQRKRAVSCGATSRTD